LASDADMSSWAGLAGSIVNLGFAGLVGWYLLTKALPKMQETFSNELAKQRLEAVNSENVRRQEARDALKQVIDHCEREMSRKDAAIAKELSEATKVMEDVRMVMEEVRDVNREVRVMMNNPNWRVIRRQSSPSTKQRQEEDK
jgi:hypothetical protein